MALSDAQFPRWIARQTYDDAMRLLTLWWAVLAAGMVGATGGGWVALIAKWTSVADGNDLVSRAMAIGFVIAMAAAIAFVMRQAPLNEGPFGDGDTTSGKYYCLVGMLPIIAMMFEPAPVLVVLIAGVLSTTSAGLIVAGATYIARFGETWDDTTLPSVGGQGSYGPYDQERGALDADPVEGYLRWDADDAHVWSAATVYDRQQASAFMDRGRRGHPGCETCAAMAHGQFRVVTLPWVNAPHERYHDAAGEFLSGGVG